jgi:ABC-type branched-subunit amino acid transport system substrate-binding protein
VVARRAVTAAKTVSGNGVTCLCRSVAPQKAGEDAMSFSDKAFAMVFTLSLACLFGGLATGPAAAAETTTIRIGAVVDQTGGSTSPLYRAAVELAARQINEALERSGGRIRFEIVFGDSKSNPPFAQGEALRLVNQERVNALVTDSSGVTVAVNRLNYDPASPSGQKVPITCFQCSSSFINDPNVTDADSVAQSAQRDLDNWLFRVFYVAKYEAAVLVQIALAATNGGKGNDDGNFKIGIFADGGHRALATAIGPTVASFYKGAAATEIIYMSTLDKLGADWSRVVDNVNETTGKTDGPPDVVLVAMLPEAAAAAIKAYRQAGHTIPILSNNSFRRNYILKTMGPEANGLEGSSVTLVDKSASGEAFLKAFQAATGQTPEMTSSGAYDATAMLMLAALVAAGDADKPRDITPADIRRGLTLINNPAGQVVRPTVEDFRSAIGSIAKGQPINYEGAYNPNDWDAVGDMFPPLVHWKVENQRFVEYELYRCSPQQPLCPTK